MRGTEKAGIDLQRVEASVGVVVAERDTIGRRAPSRECGHPAAAVVGVVRL
jgi:hypothetical protein